MNLKFALSSLLFSAAASGAFATPEQAPAGAPGVNMTPQQMQEMIVGAAKMQACMKKLDPTVFQRMNNDGYAMQQRVAELCTTGEREQAQKEAIAYGQKVKASQDYQLVQKCASPMMRQVAEGFFAFAEQQKEGEETVHVCDHIAQMEEANQPGQ